MTLSVCPFVSAINPYLSHGEKHWPFIPHTKIVQHMSVRNDFDSRSFWASPRSLKGKMPNSCLVYHKSYLWRIFESSYFTQRLFLTQGCFVILTQGHRNKFNVIGQKQFIICVPFIPFL